jgi:hypothetical protein
MQYCGEWVCTEVAATATDDEGIEHEDTQQQQQQASNEQTSTAQLNGDNTDTAKKPNKIVVAINSLFNTVYRMTVATIYRFAAVEPGIVQTISASLSLSLSLSPGWQLATCHAPDLSRSKIVVIAHGLLEILKRHNRGLVYLAFIANTIANADLIAMAYTISAFAYAIIEYPYPNPV